MHLKSDVTSGPTSKSLKLMWSASHAAYILIYYFYRQSCCWIIANMRVSLQGESQFRSIVMWSQSDQSGSKQMICLSANTFPTSLTELSWNMIRKKTKNLTPSLRDMLELSITWYQTENVDSGEEDDNDEEEDDNDDDDEDDDDGKLWQDSFLILRALNQTKVKGQISLRSFKVQEWENFSWIEKWLVSDLSRWRPESV